MWDESPYHALLLALVAFNTVMSILTFLELPHRRRDWRKPP